MSFDKRLQRRDVDDLRLVPQSAVESLPHQIVDRRHEGRERLAGTGGRGNQHIAPGLDGGPSLRLRGRRRAESYARTRRQRQDGTAKTNSWTGTMPRSFAGKRPDVRDEARGQFMGKLAQIWDQLTLNQSSCPVDR